MSTSDTTTTRVLYLLPDFDLAGGQVVVRRTINALPEAEWHHVVVAVGGGPLLEAYRSDGIHCEVIGDGTPTSWPAALIRLVRLVRRERIDVMLSANTPLDRTMAQLCAAITRRPVVVWFMSIAIPLIRFPPPPGRRLAFFKRLALYPFNVLSVRRLRALVATSDAVARSFADHLRLRPTVSLSYHPGCRTPPSIHRWIRGPRKHCAANSAWATIIPILLNVAC